MASLIVAAGILVHNKVHDKKQAKREKKRLAYEARYRELEEEYASHQEKLPRQRSVREHQCEPRHGETLGPEE
ncbi:uncharacterized protein Z518_02008 [Rhinocladiella mackenziei CBS 650.93]|uniref:Uncharacterized protein n=1 Tax=Rhinocladiella mackenziei CBS 650.93 TaxID=1442369 RepID=A0A0D2JDR2_9EURO|nr:uncharacterized protein Z518_02008 [Rhinocladiella mackenziei CBS 650.93]KIX07355.1 hypothetical protein Z518_02008 [Rhinocladiella mackenziei CBS 650.93]